jgi:hypothetical protein
LCNLTRAVETSSRTDRRRSSAPNDMRGPAFDSLGELFVIAGGEEEDEP